ncbi:hypothetical protein [Streptomyces sp. NPDC015131]|uniref:hypothetical protein n=1 Tax=Streptomyces sp. NPDC015131 TaxID=3364941 RepID=UPI0036FC62F4
MALGDTYATLPQLKAYMGDVFTDPSRDAALGDALNSASREIERYCGRQFNNAGAVSAREFLALNAGRAFVDDFHTTTGLVVEVEGSDGTWTPWASGDYKLLPRNGIRDGMPGWPYTEIRAVRGGGKTFPGPYDEAHLRVTANWGWASVPAPVKQACLILAAETFQLRDAPLGVAGTNEFGVVRVRDNKIAAAKLVPYRRAGKKVA